MFGMFSKKVQACSIVMFSTSLMDFPLYLTSSVSRLYRFPLHVSQVTYTSGRKFISMVFTPAPPQLSQRPPFTLNENLPGLYPLIFDSGIIAYMFRISVNTL